MSANRRGAGKGKVPVPVPVINDEEDGETQREEEMRRWEEEQAKRLAIQETPAGAPVAPAPLPSPSAPVTERAAPAATAEPSGKTTAPGFLPSPAFTEPPSEDPEERLDFYTRGILAVEYAARANHERAEQQKLIGLGLRLRAIKEEELHKTAGFDTFGDLVLSRFGFKKHYANNVIRVLGVAQALESVTTRELKERPLRVLVPILETHGPAAVRDTWVEASRHGNVTDTSLREAANFLGFAPPQLGGSEGVVQVKPERIGSPSRADALVAQLRKLAEKDPAAARREAEALEQAAAALVRELAGAGG
ncbi:hypothetical protein [Streptomyces sp. NEAU-H3]|uniref:hypothetical protein n=1 Tax=Streptomyces sp. NEAU-H3 TaxID=2720636 RepID=UPI001439BBA4|nr:hypothetical protein [Streptomyces sp. NEAU-H3]NJA56713.1 hypothetical protein [Streptomyces sp. NEAU-H3]